MFNVEQSIFINRPMQAVFDMITDPTRITEWGSTDSAEWVTDAPHGVGSKRKSTGKFLGRRLETVGEVTVWEPATRFEFKTDGSAKARLDHILESKDGGTQLTVRGEVDLSGLIKIAEPLLKRQVDKQMSTDIGAIKLILESEGD